MEQLRDCYARLLVDNHISDIRPEYMSRFSAREYLRLVKEAGVESAMVYACDHNGNCYYPTQVGHAHRNLKGDNFGETVSLLRQEGIVPVAYYTVNYNNDCARRFPQARLRDNVGHDHDGRYHFTCPNQPDAEAFYCAQLKEVLQYDIDGLFIDMTFWPSICCCDGCHAAYGKPFPKIIDWDSPEWVSFQRFREESMAAFAKRLTDFAKKIRPGIRVVHQFSPVLHGWYLGQSSGIALASDYASGDFYGGKLQQRFAVKVFDAYTRQPPFEFMTSRCVNLRDHTSCKSDEEMYMSALTTLANGGAYFFIDAINPDGTMEEPFYRRLGVLNRRLTPYREAVKTLNGRLAAEVGLYFSMTSCVDRQWNGQKLDEFDGGCANNMQMRKNDVMEECLGFAEALNRLHIPWKVLTDTTEDYTGLKAIILPNAAYLSPEECDRLRSFVAKGGFLLATGAAALYGSDGVSTGNFALADVLGVDYTGKRSDCITYTGNELILAQGEAPLVRAGADTTVRAFLTFPDFPAFDPERYASIHSNPPSSIPSTYPALTLHSYGKGRALWMAAPIALQRNYTQIEYLKGLCREFLPEFLASSENLPESVEVTRLKNDRGEELIGFVNAQNEFPVIPLKDVRVSLRMSESPRAIRRVSDGMPVDFQWQNGLLTLQMPTLHHAEFFQIRR